MRSFVLRFSYPTFAAMFACQLALEYAIKGIQHLYSVLYDKRYLVQRRLVNHNTAQLQQAAVPPAPAQQQQEVAQ